MARTTGKKTREKIILKAFVLFSTKQYDEVTYSDIERETELTRGAIIYHFKNKQALFDEVVETILHKWLQRVTIPNLPLNDEHILKLFILAFIDHYKTNVKFMAGQGIKNINLSYFIFETSAYCYFNDFEKRSRQIQEVELNLWTLIVRQAMEVGEIVDTIEPEVLAAMFMNLGLGFGRYTAKEENCCNIEKLHSLFFSLYDLIKK